ncbi:MAG TPA: efflux transporter outer membrane subunit, partial [Pirellulales bacterium]|jgi:NodT family efflux transporter outer membrane factor (OMF) lipoprotein|nr:efflux transporter outer membrane subunit [Pirellulales bacterium]
VRVRSETEDLSAWWSVFNDRALYDLVQTAYRQNLTLREAGFRVLQARALRGVAVGNLFPQSQYANGHALQEKLSRNAANRGFLNQAFFAEWHYGLGLAWEIDFWGRFRRAIEAADANLNASVENYDDVLVTLLGDVAANYALLRTVEQQLAYVHDNIELQRRSLVIAQARFQGGQTTEVDVDMAQSILSQTEALVPQLKIQRRQVNNRLCVLLGMPVEDLEARLGAAPIPSAPSDVAVGIPADLLRRRPDVRRQERLAAAQSAQIGIAQADFYPAISITGDIGYTAAQFSRTFSGNSLEGFVGPTFQWKILNYGRIRNNVRVQRAAFQETVAAYQQTVLQANEEAENGLIEFLQSQQETTNYAESVAASKKAVTAALAQYDGGLVSFIWVSFLEQNLVQQQNQLALAKNNIAQGLIQVYRALGGGWQIRLRGGEAVPGQVPGPAREEPIVPAAENLPPPEPAGEAGGA